MQVEGSFQKIKQCNFTSCNKDDVKVHLREKKSSEKRINSPPQSEES